MNPLEAMAKAMFEDDRPGWPWEVSLRPDWNWKDAPAECRTKYLRRAKTALNALADNVNETMRNALEDRRHDLAAAIRAAGEG